MKKGKLDEDNLDGMEKASSTTNHSEFRSVDLKLHKAIFHFHRHVVYSSDSVQHIFNDFVVIYRDSA